MKLNIEQKKYLIELLDYQCETLPPKARLEEDDWEIKRTIGTWGYEYHLVIGGQQYNELLVDDYRAVKCYDYGTFFKVGQRVKAIFDKYGKHPFIGTIKEIDKWYAHIQVEQWLDKDRMKCMVCIPVYDLVKEVD